MPHTVIAETTGVCLSRQVPNDTVLMHKCFWSTHSSTAVQPKGLLTVSRYVRTGTSIWQSVNHPSDNANNDSWLTTSALRKVTWRHRRKDSNYLDMTGTVNTSYRLYCWLLSCLRVKNDPLCHSTCQKCKSGRVMWFWIQAPMFWHANFPTHARVVAKSFTFLAVHLWLIVISEHRCLQSRPRARMLPYLYPQPCGSTQEHS